MSRYQWLWVFGYTRPEGVLCHIHIIPFLIKKCGFSQVPPLLPLQACPPTTSALIPAKTQLPKIAPQDPQHRNTATPPPQHRYTATPLHRYAATPHLYPYDNCLSESDFAHETYGDGGVYPFPLMVLPQLCSSQTWRVLAAIQPLAFWAR